MTKKFKAVKASILTGIVLISVIAAIMPTTSAGPIFKLQSVLNVSWGNETDQPVIPRGALRTLDLVITHTVTRAVFGKAMLLALSGAQITINVQITGSSPWCTATLTQGTLSIQVIPDTIQTVTTKLSLQVEDSAPAFGVGFINVKATAQKAGLIAGYEKEFSLTFVPDYKPLIQPAYPDTNTKEIGPMDTAVFPIEITNLGNARTVVFLTVTNVPTDWNAIITDQVILGEGEGSTGTAYLTIKPPKGFGYHYDEKSITITMQPAKWDEQEKRGSILTATFLVQSRGFSTPGFEAIAFIGALAAVLLITCIAKRKK